jgi:imidazolonepropionase-like amidohydrolase
MPKLFSIGGWIALISSGALAQTNLAAPLQEFVKIQGPVIALTHARVIDGTGSPARQDQTVVISAGKIQSVGDASKTKVPAGAKVLEMSGKTLIPGLVGMHNHMYYPTPGAGAPMYGQHTFSFPRLYLAGGVTTMRTTGSVETYSDLETKKLIDAGQMVGPKMHITGPYMEGPDALGVQLHQLKDAEDARKMAEYWMDTGVTSFKVYMHITRAELAAVVKAAHARGIKVTGHLCSIGFNEAAAIGIDNLEHGLMVDTEFYSQKKPDACPGQKEIRKEMISQLEIASARVQEMIRNLVAHHVAVTSTLPVFETFVPNRAPLQKRILEAMAPQARLAYLQQRSVISDGAAESPWPVLFKQEMQFERAFVQAGGLLLAGLDPTGYGGVIAGFGDQREVELLVEAGFTPLEAIHIATANGAEFLGESDKIGTIAAGKQADLVVIRGDPSKNISDIENVEIVFKDGVGFDSPKLIESTREMVGLK